MDFDAELLNWPSLSHLMTLGPFCYTPEEEVTKKMLIKVHYFCQLTRNKCESFSYLGFHSTIGLVYEFLSHRKVSF
jgi:hypothetical protein